MRASRLKILASAALFLCCSGTQDLSAQTLPFRYYSTAEGLPSTRISTVYQDKRGYLWIGTDGGLAIYDGLNFRKLGTADGLPSGYILDVVESRFHAGRFYIGTHGGGIAILDSGVLTTRRLPDRYPGNVVQLIVETGPERLLCSTANGVYDVGPDSARLILDKVSSEGGPILIPISPETIWVSAIDSLYSWSVQTGAWETVDIGVPYKKFTAWIFDEQGSFWAGVRDGRILKLEGGKVVAMQNLPYGYVRDIVDDGSGSLWYATWRGIVRVQKDNFPNGEFVRYTAANGLRGVNMLRCMRDRENNLWFGSNKTGLAKLSRPNVYQFDRREISSRNSRDTAALSSRNHLYVPSRDGLWEYWRDSRGAWRRKVHQLSSYLKEDAVFAVQIDNEDVLWVGVERGGIFGFRLRNAAAGGSELIETARLAPPKKFATSSMRTFSIDAEQQLWVSFVSYDARVHRGTGGLVQFDVRSRKLVKTHTLQDGLPSHTVMSVSRDREGRIWLGGFNGGLAIFDKEIGSPGPLGRYTKDDGLVGNGINDMLPVGSDAMWVATRFDGISIVTDSAIRNFSEKDGLTSNVIHALARHPDGKIWIATPSGLVKTDPATPEAFTAVRILEGGQFNTIGFIPELDAFYGVGPTAVTLYEYGRDRLEPVPVPVSITGIRLNGRPTKSAPDANAFVYDENLYEIDYTGIGLRDEGQLKYEYALRSEKGIAWRGETHERRVQYTSLGPDDYTFSVAAVTPDGVRSPELASLSFSIQPPIWQRWWFVSLAAIALLAVLYAMHRLRLQKLLEIEKIRSRIATDLHDEIGAGLTHIGLLSEVALRQAASEKSVPEPPTQNDAANGDLKGSVARMGEVARELSGAMSDVVWCINPKHDSVRALHRRLKAFANEICQAKGIELHMDVPERLLRLKLHPEARRNLLLIAKEALHNATKYASSPAIEVRLRQDGDALEVVVQDQGKGFTPNGSTGGNGLANMRSRAEKLGGRFDIDSSPGQGTRIAATIPYSDA